MLSSFSWSDPLCHLSCMYEIQEEMNPLGMSSSRNWWVQCDFTCMFWWRRTQLCFSFIHFNVSAVNFIRTGGYWWFPPLPPSTVTRFLVIVFPQWQSLYAWTLEWWWLVIVTVYHLIKTFRNWKSLTLHTEVNCQLQTLRAQVVLLRLACRNHTAFWVLPNQQRQHDHPATAGN